MKLITRDASREFDALLKAFPAVLVVGPRQCGKTTFVRHHLRNWEHFDLERPSDLALIESDPEGFFRSRPRHVAIDEAQRGPQIFALLRHVIDQGRGKGRFVLLGSASPDLVVAGSETLAGRIGILELTPFLGRELVNRKIADDRMFWGGFPPVLELADDESRLRWIESYIATFLERDIRDYGFRIPAPRLRRFWTMLAHVHGGILNVSDLARAMDMDQKSILRQLDILEQTLMIRRLEPYFVNISKRLVKAPKLYIRDNGILHFLAGLRTKSDLDVWPRRGSSFESAAIEEFIALARRSVVHPEFFYWRTHAGAEVDLLIKSGKSILPIEFKMGATLDQYSFAALRTVLDDLDLPRAWLVYGGRERRSVGKIEVIPWADVLADRVQIF